MYSACEKHAKELPEVVLDHTIVPVADRQAAAAFLADLLGLVAGPAEGPFVPVVLDGGTTPDFDDRVPPAVPGHWGYRVDDATFDAALAPSPPAPEILCGRGRGTVGTEGWTRPKAVVSTCALPTATSTSSWSRAYPDHVLLVAIEPGVTLAETTALVSAAPLQNPEPPANKGEEFGKASPVALVVILVLAVVTAFLIRNMTKRIRRLPESFDPPAASTDEPADASGDADRERS